MPIIKIVSGGQTGADRGGLEAAIYCGVPHGGWCPKGRKAEDGHIPGKYNLREMDTADYLARTKANVLDAACDLGMQFQQDAIYHIADDLLSVTHCDHRRKLIHIGGFRERLDDRPKSRTDPFSVPPA